MATIDMKGIKFRYTVYGLLCLVTLYITLNKMNSRQSLWYDKSKECLYCKEFYKPGLNVTQIRKTIDRFIPDDAAFAGTQGILPHYAFRDKTYIFPYVHDAKYIALLKKGSTYPLTQKEYAEAISGYLNNPGWKVILDSDEMMILKRK
jgi:hypothetical protein